MVLEKSKGTSSDRGTGYSNVVNPNKGLPRISTVGEIHQGFQTALLPRPQRTPKKAPRRWRAGSRSWRLLLIGSLLIFVQWGNPEADEHGKCLESQRCNEVWKRGRTWGLLPGGHSSMRLVFSAAFCQPRGAHGVGTRSGATICVQYPDLH